MLSAAKHLCFPFVLLAAASAFADGDKLEPGLTLSFGNDSRTARLVALYVPEGAAPSVFTAPGRFTAIWDGFLNLDIRDDYIFSAEGTGSFKLTIDGEIALEKRAENLALPVPKSIRIKKGKHHFIARYESPEKGDAWVRLYWSGSEFSREPVSPLVFTHELKPAPAREGRDLFVSLRCLKCHKTDAAPELVMDAPAFAEIGSRLNQDWMARWIANPRALRPQAAMPKLGLDDQAAADMAAFLATLGKKSDAPVSADAKAGGDLFAHLRCVGCHTLTENDEAIRIPLRYVKAKFQPKALLEFLRQPERHYAWIRMPNFKLTEDEAAKLAAFLLSKPGTEISKSTGDVERGKKFVQTAGCLNCHTLEAPNLSTPPPATVDWSRFCKRADYALSEGQRQALAKADIASLEREVPVEFAERQINMLRCAACHQRDGEQDTWSSVSAEAPPPDSKASEGEQQFSVDQSPPALTWTGEKLKPEWMAKVLAGEVPYKPRPWLHARMPAFPTRAKLIAGGLAEEHGYPPVSPADPAPDVEQAKVGKRLVGAESGFKCNACHDIGKEKAVGVFEAPAPNFAYAKERLRHEYFLRWVTNPARVTPGTKMPQFSPDEKKTPIADVLEGDAPKQFETIWQYLLQLGRN